LRGSTIKVESREEIYDRIKRSPDWASAYVLALMDSPKARSLRRTHTEQHAEYDPYAYSMPRSRGEHNPYA
jgi:hypothetical protein